MLNIFRILQIAAALILVIVVLLQQRGSSLSVAFGGSNTAYRSRRGIEKFLFVATIVVASIFALTSLAVVFLSK